MATEYRDRKDLFAAAALQAVIQHYGVDDTPKIVERAWHLAEAMMQHDQETKPPRKVVSVPRVDNEGFSAR